MFCIHMIFLFPSTSESCWRNLRLSTHGFKNSIKLPTLEVRHFFRQKVSSEPSSRQGKERIWLNLMVMALSPNVLFNSKRTNNRDLLRKLSSIVEEVLVDKKFDLNRVERLMELERESMASLAATEEQVMNASKEIEASLEKMS